ncbi:hypothetical protein BKA60DRAFT_587693 [Fusarium oxysporum]|nr:hypothetical protein BKA60DRAFT_587693 [Fusarium oxysporum]
MRVSSERPRVRRFQARQISHETLLFLSLVKTGMHSFALPSGQRRQGIKVLKLDAVLQRVFLRQFKASGLRYESKISTFGSVLFDKLHICM